METAVKERPINRNAEQVKAILRGATQLRDVVKPQPVHIGQGGGFGIPAVLTCKGDWAWPTKRPNTTTVSSKPNGPTGWAEENSPYGAVGDRLWVRETWMPLGVRCGCYEQPCDCCLIDVVYSADGHKKRFDEWSIDPDWECPKAASRGNVPSIHMPRWASRLTLEITGVRVERLQDITDEDAIAEGIKVCNAGTMLECYWDYGENTSRTPVMFKPSDSFFTLWESINGDGAWESNPWVWVVSFRRVDP